MVMTLNLDYWETLSLTAGCNLYGSKFHICVLTVRLADEQQKLNNNPINRPSTQSSHLKESISTMYFRERDKTLLPIESFLATSVPKLLIGSLIIFLNVLAIVTMIRSNRWITSRAKGYYYVLPQSTQGLLHSLFFTYFLLGLFTLYSQISLSTFILGEYRIVSDQGKECLVVNSVLIGLSLSVSLHLVSLAVDRTLASYLPYQKYATMSRGTVPLWLLSIWLPSLILTALPLSGWKNNFRFCIFLYQFNDDYLRFISGFFFSCMIAIPCLYLFFLIFLKPKIRDEQTLYRWHRKLQSHHRLTFILVVLVNMISWTPFHLYLLLACQSCSYSHIASGFTLEYLFTLALVPSVIIPLMFSIRSSFVDKCLQKLGQCISFNNLNPDGGYGYSHKNPLSQRNPHQLASLHKSPLFFVDEIHTVRSTNSSSLSTDNNVNRGASVSNNDTVRSANFFVPHYLPSNALNNYLPHERTTESTSREHNYQKFRDKRQGIHINPDHPTYETTNANCNNFKSSFKNKYESYKYNSANNSKLPSTHKYKSSSYKKVKRPAPSPPPPPQQRLNTILSNDVNQSHQQYSYYNEGGIGDMDENPYDSLDESDMKYGFPILDHKYQTIESRRSHKN